jgi:WD40 repeat protein
VAAGHNIEHEVPGMIRLWDVESGRLVSTLAGHTKRLCSVQFSRDGKMLVSSSFDKTVRLWDVAQGKPLKTLEGHTDRVESATFTVDGKRVVSVGNQDNPVVVMWDIASGSILYQSAPTPAGLLDVITLPDGQHLLTSGKDGVVRLWQWKR